MAISTMKIPQNRALCVAWGGKGALSIYHSLELNMAVLCILLPSILNAHTSFVTYSEVEEDKFGVVSSA